jgi:predicted glycogen debranching enzyme
MLKYLSLFGKSFYSQIFNILFMGANQETRLKTDDFSFEDYPVLETSRNAASMFVKNINGEVQIWASSTDWFMYEFGRDAFISLPGLLLVNKRFEDAKKVFMRFAKFQKKGLIPNNIQNENIQYNSADASMWFIQALKKYLNYTNDFDFVNDMLPVLRRIIGSYKNGTSYGRYGREQVIKMDADGLIVSPEQGTWMDADAFGKTRPVTPRNGKAVEINALWYDNLRFLAKFDSDYDSLADAVKKSFKKFWNRSEKALLDVIEGDPHGGAIRPNMIFAVSNCEDLLSKSRQKMVVRKVEKDLLTPGGLRTLSPRDSYYKGTYDTSLPFEQKDQAYHQGTAWPWLIGGFCDAFSKIGKWEKIPKIIGPLVRFCLESPFKSLPEVFSGDPPYEPGGTKSQAWSVAEVLRILVEHKIV